MVEIRRVDESGYGAVTESAGKEGVIRLGSAVCLGVNPKGIPERGGFREREQTKISDQPTALFSHSRAIKVLNVKRFRLVLHIRTHPHHPNNTRTRIFLTLKYVCAVPRPPLYGYTLLLP